MEWIKIFAHEEEARRRITPMQPQLLIINQVRISLTLYNEKFYAVQDACTHQRESLSKGKVNHSGEIICPLHHYRFALCDGRAVNAHAGDLRTYPIKINGDGFFIGIG